MQNATNHHISHDHTFPYKSATRPFYGVHNHQPQHSHIASRLAFAQLLYIMLAFEIPPYIRAFRTLSIFRTHFIMWRLAGIWWLPSDTRPRRHLNRLAFLVTHGLFVILMFVDLAQTRNVSVFVEATLGITTKWMILFKALMLMHNRGLVMRMFELSAAIEGRCAAHVPAERQHLLATSRVSRRLLIGVFVGAFFTVSSGFAAVALPKARLMMWHMWLPFDWAAAASVWPYRVALGYQILANLHHCTLFATTDTYGLTFYGTLGAALDILAGRLRRLATATAGAESAADRRRALVDCVRYHHLCLEYLDTVYDLFKVHYAMQFAASSVLLCVVAFRLTTMMGGGGTSAMQWGFMGSYLVNMSVQLFIPCYFGSKLQTKSEALGEAAYDCGWPNEAAGQRTFRKVLLLFMMGAHRPMRLLTWKNMFVIELPTFVMVYRAAYSLLSFLSGF